MGEEVEQWRPWPRDAAYQVSNFGRVRGPRGMLEQLGESRGAGVKPKVVVRTPMGRLRTHSLVLETWMPGEGLRARHIDGDPWNNRLDNLVVYSLPQPRISSDQVDGLAARNMGGESIAAIADSLGLSTVTVRNALRKASVPFSEIRRQKMASKAAAKAARVADRLSAERAKTVAKYEATGRTKIREMTPEQRWEYERDHHLRSEFGLSIGGFRKILQAQAGKCALCGDPLPEWEQGCERKKDGRHPVVDHCHRSDGSAAVRGILHATCNAAIGLLGDDPEKARRAARYLERTRHARPMRPGVLQHGLEGL